MQAIDINPNTWHYKFIFKLMRRSEYRRPKDSCAYMRAFIGASFMFTLFLSFALLIATAHGFGIYEYFNSGMTPFQWVEAYGKTDPWFAIIYSFGIVASMMCYLIGGIIGTVWALGTYMEHKAMKRRQIDEEREAAGLPPLEDEVKEPNATWQLIKAYVHKFCMPIQYADEK